MSVEFGQCSKVPNEEIVEAENGEEPEETYLLGKIFLFEASVFVRAEV